MFAERGKTTEKQGMEGAVAGYDLGRQFAQISCWLPGSSKPETVSQVAGEEEFLIPAVLARRTDRELWLFGKEALECANAGEAFLVEDLLVLAATGGPVEVGEEAYDPVALLALFLKKTLNLLMPLVSVERLAAFAFTVEEVTSPVLEALRVAALQLGLKTDNIYVIGREESFFYYNISQPEELWVRDVLLCDFTEHTLKTLLFNVNRRTTPMAALVDVWFWEEVRTIEPSGDEDEDKRAGMKLDQKFLTVLSQIFSQRQVSCVYLIGAGFEGEWYQESLPLLCRDRRVFLGNNLYSKGACYAARERLSGSVSKGYAFLGKDMIKANVGMHVVRRRQDAYLALLDAGTNWYEAKKECDFLLEEENTFSLRITPVDGKRVREVVVTLSGLPSRPVRTTRIHMKLEMTDVTNVRLSMEDLGFGEFYPATHKFWEESFSLDERDED